MEGFRILGAALFFAALARHSLCQSQYARRPYGWPAPHPAQQAPVYQRPHHLPPHYAPAEPPVAAAYWPQHEFDGGAPQPYPYPAARPYEETARPYEVAARPYEVAARPYGEVARPYEAASPLNTAALQQAARSHHDYDQLDARHSNHRYVGDELIYKESISQAAYPAQPPAESPAAAYERHFARYVAKYPRRLLPIYFTARS